MKVQKTQMYQGFRRICLRVLSCPCAAAAAHRGMVRDHEAVSSNLATRTNEKACNCKGSCSQVHNVTYGAGRTVQGTKKVSRGNFPRLTFSLIPSLFERHISIGCADVIWDITLDEISAICLFIGRWPFFCLTIIEHRANLLFPAKIFRHTKETAKVFRF